MAREICKSLCVKHSHQTFAKLEIEANYLADPWRTEADCENGFRPLINVKKFFVGGGVWSGFLLFIVLNSPLSTRSCCGSFMRASLRSKMMTMMTCRRTLQQLPANKNNVNDTPFKSEFQQPPGMVAVNRPSCTEPNTLLSSQAKVAK